MTGVVPRLQLGTNTLIAAPSKAQMCPKPGKLKDEPMSWPCKEPAVKGKYHHNTAAHMWRQRVRVPVPKEACRILQRVSPATGMNVFVLQI